MLSVCLVICLVLASSAVAFASSSISGDSTILIKATQEEDDSTRSSHFKTVKVYINAESGEEKSNDVRAFWHEKHYKVYSENILTGVRHFKYDQYEWNWVRYECINNKWVKTTTRND